MGARTIVTSSSDEKLERARALGAWQTVNYRRTPDWEKAVLEMTEGRGVDLTVEVGGAGTLEKSIAATRIAGTIGFIGVLAGGTVNPLPIMRKSLTLQGIRSEEHTSETPVANAHIVCRLLLEKKNKTITH